MADFNQSPIEGRVGFAVETTEGTAMAEPQYELFMLKGNTPDIHDVEDAKITRQPFNKPYSLGEDRAVWHTEGAFSGLFFAPGNGFPELAKVAYGTPWFSSQVYTLALHSGQGALFKRGDIIFGETTSKARAEVAKVVTDTLYLYAVQGAFVEDDAISFNGPIADGGVDSTAVASGASAAVSGYYCHRLDAVNYQANKGKVKLIETATTACIGDHMVDFSKLGVATTKRTVQITVKDGATTAHYLSGWLGEPLMTVDFDAQTANFTVGKNLSAQTGAGTPAVIGVIVAVQDDGAAGTLYIDQATTARTILDNDTLVDDNSSPGNGTANMPNMPAYLNNACKVYTTPETDGQVQSWNGAIASFDNTTTMTYEAIQGIFDQKSITCFVKDAGDQVKVAKGTKIKSFSFNISHNDFTFAVDLLGRTYGYPTTPPAWILGGLTTRAPFGAEARTVEIDGSTTGQAAQIMNLKMGTTFEFTPMKGTTMNQNYPSYLQPTSWGATGTAEIQWRNNQTMKESWGGSSVTEITGGAKINKRLFIALDSGEHVTGSYPYELIVGVVGTISSATLTRDETGYTQPVTLQGIMQVSNYEWAPLQLYLFDGTATH